MAQHDLHDQNTPADTSEEPAAPITSRFLFVDVAAQRAKQLRRGARVRLASGTDGEVPADRPHKAERLAMEEVKQGLVSYELVDPNTVEGGAK